MQISVEGYNINMPEVLGTNMQKVKTQHATQNSRAKGNSLGFGRQYKRSSSHL